MVLEIAVQKVFSLLPRGLEHFVDSSNLPSNQPTFFRPSLNATVLQKFVP